MQSRKIQSLAKALTAAAFLIPAVCAAQTEGVVSETGGPESVPAVNAQDVSGWAQNLGNFLSSTYIYEGQLDSAEKATIAISVLPADNPEIMKPGETKISEFMEPVDKRLLYAKQALLAPESAPESSTQENRANLMANKLQVLKRFDARFSEEERAEISSRLGAYHAMLSEEHGKELEQRRKAVDAEINAILSNMYDMGVTPWIATPTLEAPNPSQASGSQKFELTPPQPQNSWNEGKSGSGNSGDSERFF